MQMVIYTGAVYMQAVNKHTEIVHETRPGKPISVGRKALKGIVLKLREGCVCTNFSRIKSFLWVFQVIFLLKHLPRIWCHPQRLVNRGIV